MNLSMTLIKPSPTLVYTPVEACKYFHTLGTICILHLSEYQLQQSPESVLIEKHLKGVAVAGGTHHFFHYLLMSPHFFLNLFTPDNIKSFYAFVVLLK